MPICNSSYHSNDTETETEANFTHLKTVEFQKIFVYVYFFDYMFFAINLQVFGSRFRTLFRNCGILMFLKINSNFWAENYKI